MARNRQSLKNVSFDVTTAQDMLEKLRREIERIGDAAERESIGDHVINAFWTAWHLHEWVWVAMCSDPDKRSRVLKSLGISSADGRTKNGFVEGLVKARRHLEVCRLVANSAKHVHVEVSADGPKDVQTGFRIRPSEAGAPIVLTASGFYGGNWEPMIVLDGKRHNVLGMLAGIDADWVLLVHSCLSDRPIE